jgi:demethylmenaquinone methyltransferase/2-methoxy-6-polyprenyl-1,4-benzoquinol methylase
MNSAFDAIASNFERFRALPSGVPEAIRLALWTAVQLPSPARVLDLGAGTGRFGKAFIEAGDNYTGVDMALPMLREFKGSAREAVLAQADGRQLPFNNDVFDIVLLMHFLSGTDDWQSVIDEVRRVCRNGGIIVVGSTARPESGIDTQLKQQLKVILEEMGVAWHKTQQAHRDAIRYLKLFAARHIHT